MRNQLDMQLETLNISLIQMGSLCERAIENALQALITNDRKLAKETMKNDAVINMKERDIETLCLKILLRQQPVAKDLRQVSSALKMITDMERIGDQAADIAEITLTYDFLMVQPIQDIQTMAEQAIKMVTDSIDAYVNKDLELTRKVIRDDEIVDGLFHKIKKDLIGEIHHDSSYGEDALDLLMIAKYLERIGDHATNIAEWVEFSLTGVHINEDGIEDK